MLQDESHNIVRLHLQGRSVFVDREEVPLSKSELVVCTLLFKSSSYVEYTAILNAVYPDITADLRQMRDLVRHLRKKFTKAGADGCIKTFNGVGYYVDRHHFAIEDPPSFRLPPASVGDHGRRTLEQPLDSLGH